jgi:hypothetical protein
MPKDWRNDRLDQHLGTVDADERRRVSAFLGQGVEDASNRMSTITRETSVDFKRSSLLAFQRYAAALAGTAHDFPRQVWTVRKLLLDKAISLGLGRPN